MPESRDVRPGLPFPLGATALDDGVNFALYSRGAERVQLCLFDQHGGAEQRIEVRSRTGYVWHAFVPGIRPGRLYGYRVHGPFDPSSGQRFNPARLLLDPYARALHGSVDWDARHGLLFDVDTAAPEDNAAVVPKAIVLDDAFDWQGDAPPRTPWPDTVIYETHARGFSKRHPDIPPGLQGTFLGLASKPAIEHFKRLGVTAIELLPVTARAGNKHLHDLGLTDYWGYGPIAYFAPDPRFAASNQPAAAVGEFKTMVRELHRHGLEVILDVVYNHTAESDHAGPTLSFRGIDNATYYRLDPMNPARYLNYTGTGNTLDLSERAVLRLVLDSLRYWVEVMHVDGFRFDLTATLARGVLDFDERSSFLDAVYQDPVLSQVKLIAEPWDLGPDGYVAGRFPAPWAEWNDRYRDDIRRYWRGDEIPASQIARRLTASPDIFATAERSPQASINFVTCHDGFTLHDLVSYATKHNEANGEDNHDGPNQNFSQNFGVEGPTSDPDIIAKRQQQQRNLLATLLFSQGVPMLLGGDEIGRTQLGNNNAYNQDNHISWYDWDLDQAARDLLSFTARLLQIRRRHPVLRRRTFLDGHSQPDLAAPVRWLREDGGLMTEAEWQAPWYRCFALCLDGETAELDAHGRPLLDDTLLLVLNASEQDVKFTLPAGPWSLLVDTARPDLDEDAWKGSEGRFYAIAARSIALLRQPRTAG